VKQRRLRQRELDQRKVPKQQIQTTLSVLFSFLVIALPTEYRRIQDQ
jgi:hypothetical protein